jgi:hypothetical protein
MKPIIACAIIMMLFFSSCDRGPFAEHEVELEKVADDCSQRQTYFRINSNINGQRYEFEKCLPANYDTKKVTSERKGDTVVVNFNTVAFDSGVVYHVILDIDSYPLYNALRIDDETYNIHFSEN